MIADGHEAVGSMGDDAPPAALSQRPRLFSDFFRQRFAQVTNPSVDPYRESSVMSLTTMLGGHGSFIDELAPRPPRIVLRSPILSRRELEQLTTASRALQPVDDRHRVPGRRRRRGVRRPAAGDCRRSVRGGRARQRAASSSPTAASSADQAAVPALLAQAAVHHALVNRGLRMRASIVVETGDARDAHQIGLLFGYGASAVCPSLGYDTIAALAGADPTGCDVAVTRYRLALERGLRTLMSKMGVCTFSGYCGAQLFEILGLDAVAGRSLLPRHGVAGRRRDARRRRGDGARAAPARVRRRGAGRRVSRPPRLPPRRRVSRDQPGGRARPAEGARRGDRRRSTRRRGGAGLRDLQVARLWPSGVRRSAICSSSRRPSR